MRPWRAAFLAGWLALTLLMPLVRGVENDPVTSLEIPVEDDSPVVRSAVDHMRGTLAGVGLTPPAARTGETHSFVSMDKCYVLEGDLFGDANENALVELRSDTEGEPGIALALWHDERWELRGLWKIRPDWRPAGWHWQNGDDDEDYLPMTPVTQPFWLEHLAGDVAPWVVFVGTAGRYFQEHYVLRFDATKGRLRLFGQAMGKPEFLPGSWLRLYYNSGHRAIFEAWDYRRWNGRDLVSRVDWHEESPYNDIDAPFVRATVCHPQEGASHILKAEIVDEPLHHSPDCRISRDGLPFASITFIRRHPLAPLPVGEDQLERAYLFERLAGLPRWLYPQRDFNVRGVPRRKPDRLLEHFIKVRVRGSAVAVRLLATPLGRGGF